MRAILLALLLTNLVRAELVEERIQIRRFRTDELLSILRTLQPDLRCTLDQDTLTLAGPRDNVDIAKELVEQLKRPPEEIQYYLRLFTLETDEIPNLKFSWLSHQIGLTYRPCLGTSDSYVDWFVSQEQATMLASPTVIGTLGQECGLDLLESSRQCSPLGLRLRLTGVMQKPGRVSITLNLAEQWPHWQRKLHTENLLGDGTSLVIRGLAEDHAGQTAAGLNELPIWGPLFHPVQHDRELMLMVSAETFQ